MALGAAFLVVAGGLTVFMLRRSRRNRHASLITRSMRKK
jgi:peptidase E